MATETKLVSEEYPEPHARYLVKREATGPFVATPCYGMHAPWWVPLVADLYQPGGVVFPMEPTDRFSLWPEADERKLREAVKWVLEDYHFKPPWAWGSNWDIIGRWMERLESAMNL